MTSSYISSEKGTDISSNQSTVSEQVIFNQNQLINKNDNILNEEKKQNNNKNFIRKYTIEPKIFRKEFVPVLKPIEIHLVPSKLRLNEVGFKHRKKKNFKKDLLSCFSCPCSEEENSDRDNDFDLSNSSDISELSDLSQNINKIINENGIKGIRRQFIKLKSDSIHKVMTKNTLKNKKAKQFDCFDKINDNYEDNINNIYKENEYEDSFSSDLYEDNNNFTNYSIQPQIKIKQNKSSNQIINSNRNNDNIFNNDNYQNNSNGINKKRDRIYSFSILDTFKNKLRIDN